MNWKKLYITRHLQEAITKNYSGPTTLQQSLTYHALAVLNEKQGGFVSTEEGKALAKKYNFDFCETSALYQTGLKELFELALKRAVKIDPPKKKSSISSFFKILF